MRKITLNLTKRADGRYAKKIDGKYLTWPSEESARAEIIEMIRRGQQTTKPVVDPPLRVIANQYCLAKETAVAPETLKDYEEAIGSFLAMVGKHRRPSELTPDDFGKVRNAWVKAVGPWRIDNRVQSVRTMFNWARKVGRLIEVEPWYGESFSKTTKAEKRRNKVERIFTRDELRVILGEAKGWYRTFTLLALNGGMYAADIAQIRKVEFKRIGKVFYIDNLRGKTGVPRKLVLWPETAKAIQETMDRSDNELLFLTAHGNPWVGSGHNSIVGEYTDFLKDCGIKRPGINFGAFKHTHVTAVGAHPDLNAAKRSRGHEISGIESHYDFPDLSRLKTVTDLARKKLLTSVLARKKRRPSHS